jgi:plasmid maintenance system killer protein
MEQIVIEVDDATGKKWRDVSPKIKSQLEKSFERQIQIISQGIQEDKFKSLLDKVGEEAAKNGLTEEILQQLLNEE